MSHTIVPINLPDLSEIDTEDQTDDKDSVYDFRQLLDAIIEMTDVILTVDSSHVDMLKDGLTVRKAKDNQKLKKAGLRPGTEVLNFTVYPAKDDKGDVILGQSCVRVKLGARKSIPVLKFELPDDKL